MLASAAPSLPVKSETAPIVNIPEWIESLNAAKASWEAKGSPANDVSFFRPFVTQIYKVFNELNCLNLSFRIVKDEQDKKNDESLKAAATSTESKPQKDGDDTIMADDGASATTASSATIDSPYVEPTEFSPGIDYVELDAFYEAILSVVVTESDGSESRPVLTAMMNGFRALLNELILRPIQSNQVHPALMRALPIMYENTALWFDPSSYELLKLLCKFLSILPRSAKKLLVSWMCDVERWRSPADAAKSITNRPNRMYSTARLEMLLGALQQFISVRIYDKQDLRDVVPAVIFISCLHEANENLSKMYRSIPISVPKVARLPIPIEPQLWYNDAINNEVDLKQDFRRWVQQSRAGTSGGSSDFSFFKYNFILDAGSKANLLKYDSQMQQHQQYRDSLIMNGMDQRAGYLILEVRRNNLIADTMRSLANKSPADYKKPCVNEFST